MKRRIHDALLGIVGIAGLAFFAVSGASCESPVMQCAAGHGPYIVKYEKVGGSGADTCYGVSGEEVGFSTFLTVKNRKETTDPVTGVKTVTADGADYNTRNIAIQSTAMGGLHRSRLGVGTDDADVPYAFGPLTSTPDDKDLCYTGGGNGSAALAAADLNIDAVDTEPAIHVTQEWKNVTFFVTTGVPGTQVSGEMTFRDHLANCDAQYKFYGLYPAVYCGEDIFEQVDNDMDPATPVDNDKDDDGDPATPVNNDRDDDEDPATPVDDDDGTAGPDVDADEPEYIRTDPIDITCDPKGDPAVGRLGSGINPDFQTSCDPELFYCVLKPGTELVK